MRLESSSRCTMVMRQRVSRKFRQEHATRIPPSLNSCRCNMIILCVCVCLFWRTSLVHSPMHIRLILAYLAYSICLGALVEIRLLKHVRHFETKVESGGGGRAAQKNLKYLEVVFQGLCAGEDGPLARGMEWNTGGGSNYCVFDRFEGHKIQSHIIEIIEIM